MQTYAQHTESRALAYIYAHTRRSCRAQAHMCCLPVYDALQSPLYARLTSALEQLSQKVLRDQKMRMCFQQHPICDDAFSLRRTDFSDFPPVRDDDSCIMQLSVEASEEWEKRRNYSWQLWSSLETRSQKSPAMTQPVVGCVFMFVCVPVHLCVSVEE